VHTGKVAKLDGNDGKVQSSSGLSTKTVKMMHGNDMMILKSKIQWRN
jgi:hypothetical protein